MRPGQKEKQGNEGMGTHQKPAAKTRSRPNLTDQVTAKLRKKLAGGELKIGDRLPTEQALCQTYGVSRTVVREAIAALRADGLVQARQGSGVYVSRKPDQPFDLSLLNVKPDQISSVIETLELRAAVESEAAALAAERRSPTELAKIHDRHDAVSKALEAGERAEDQDFMFHLAIAEATHNQYFVEFFKFLGNRTIPRNQAFTRDASVATLTAFLERIQSEHSEIVEAIEAGDATKAHAAMRAHLSRSKDRYQRLAAGKD